MAFVYTYTGTYKRAKMWYLLYNNKMSDAVASDGNAHNKYTEKGVL